MIAMINCSRFNLDYTDGISEMINNNTFRHTCLYVTGRSVYKINNSQQIISYCLNEWRLEWNMKKNNRDRRFTFAELRKQNITSQQLYLWFAPLDLIERYQLFLNDPTSFNGMKTHEYYNCSLPWFGPMCEYKFDQYESNNFSFTDIISNFYETTDTFQSLTCYKHLKCDRNGISLCLDWSDICDGNIDCFNEGRDEEHCWQLEINECNDNEFRCLNGQCIDSSLYHDDIDNPDCSDGSDEAVQSLKDGLCMNSEPTVFCEDISCVIVRELDGMTAVVPCKQVRRDTREKTIFSIKESSISDTCWSALICRISLGYSLGNVPCRQLCRNPFECEQIIEKECPSLIYVPVVPILFNHVYFVYTNNRTDNSRGSMPPTYVCYTQQLCPELPITIILPSLNNATCRRFSEIPSFHGLYTPPLRFSGHVTRLNNVFHACRSTINNYNSSVLCNTSSIYQCVNSTKCISVHYINNGIRDCFYGDDEQQIMTMERRESLKPSKNWYKCEALNVSISSHLVASTAISCYCPDNCDDQITDDARYIQTHISFQTICDGFVELKPKMIGSKEETDETECEQWSCNNIYTHCDGIWNCNNGADELGCNQSLLLNCNQNEHGCISSSTYQPMCLPHSKAGDNIVDCLGGTDEPNLCQRHDLKEYPPPGSFFCIRQPKNCTDIRDLCATPKCDNGEDINFCTTINITTWYSNICNEDLLHRSDLVKYMCDILIFSKKKMIYFSLDKPSKSIEQLNSIQPRSKFADKLSSQQDYCHRGINVRILVDSDKNVTSNACLCPSSYYGNKCQYQNQRVSLTLKIKTVSNSWNVSFAVVVSLIDDDDEQIINFPEQVKHFTYIFVRDCQSKTHLTLLYPTRPKNITKNYSLRIDVYEKESLNYRSSWIIPILFSFLPVHRMTNLLTIPSQNTGGKTCNDSQCVHGQCIYYTDHKMNKTFCRCNPGWFGRFCTITHQCTCSNDSLCIGMTVDHRSLCVCPLKKFGPRCLLDQPACQNNSCQNGGYCVPKDENLPSENNFKCICPDGFSGDKCEIMSTEIRISFRSDMSLPQVMLVYLIHAPGNEAPTRTAKYKKIPLSSDSVTMYTSDPFHILIVEFSKYNYYLGLAQKTFNRSTIIRSTIDSSYRCQHLSELFNETFSKRPLIHRIKYYHLPCRNKLSNLFCFIDDVHICLCTDHGDQRTANCFEFDHDLKFDCLGQSVCENNASCYYDNSNCPRASVCQCPECFYGIRCQFNTKGFGLSLDAILGYYIQPYTNLLRQPSVIQISATLTMIMFVMGMINGIFCIMTFKVKQLHETGCGIYLICLSIMSLITMIIFALKFWLLILSQMATITNQLFLYVQCKSIDFLLRTCLDIDQWLSACVAIERAITVLQRANFNKWRSKQIAKWMMIFVVVLVTLSSVTQEVIYKRLVDDNDDDEKRTWCVSTYSQGLQVFNSIVHIFHVAAPCLINLISAIIITKMIAQQRAIVHSHQTYRKHLIEQLQQHKHLFISPCILVILAIPRLVLAFTSGCMKSARSPWLFLAGYLISFIPPLVTFITFVLPSETYKKIFKKSYEQYRKAIQRCLYNTL